MSEFAGSGEREIRLALVCYGGVSLAVYMAGITREIQYLVEASQAMGTEAECSLTGTAAAYAAALRRRAEREGIPTRIIVDVITGTSAGGIDGIFLAKALATGADQAPLRQIWLEQGDVARLVRGRGFWWPLRLAFFFARVALRRRGALAPLDGDLLLRHAYRELRAMNPPGARSGAKPTDAERTLDLFVTVTDVAGRVRSVTVGPSDKPVVDRTHRYVLHLQGSLPQLRPERSEAAELGQLGPGHDAALAFAARATSSFPGAFAQVRLDDVEQVLTKEEPSEAPRQMQTLREELFDSYDVEDQDPRRSRYFDGGVLDNFPFEHAISAIQRKPAGREVDRYLVVLEPDPGEPRRAEGKASEPADAENEPAPGWVATLLAGVIGVRLHEPILDELIELREANERLHRVDELVERLNVHVQKRLDARHLTVSRDSSYPEIQQATKAMHESAVSEAGLAWPHYLELRLDAITARLGETVTEALGYPRESPHAAHVRAVLRRLVVDKARGKDDPPSEDFFRRYDLPLRERRLRLAVRTVNAEYSRNRGECSGNTVERPLLDATKAALYGALRRLWAVPAAVGRSLPAPAVLQQPKALAEWLDRDTDRVKKHHNDLQNWLKNVGDAIERELEHFGKDSWQRLAATLASWPPDRAAVVVRTFVGFPLWDVSVFPFLAASRVQQFTPVRMLRISPVDATALSGDKSKLRGIPLHHFAAFLDRTRRENDYVWGRLDATECLLRLVDEHTTGAQRAEAFSAVVRAESDLAVLKRRRSACLRAFLEDRIQRLRAAPNGDRSNPPSP